MYVLVIYVLTFIAGVLELEKKISRKQALCIFAVIATIFLFRYNIGLDNGIYKYLFERVQNPITEAFYYHASRNVGFNLLEYIVKNIFHSYTVFVFVVNLLVLGFTSYMILKYSYSILFSLGIFISSGFLQVYYSSGIRQACAMAIFFFAFYKTLPKKKYGEYYFWSLIACSFHESAIITLLFPGILKYIAYIKENQKKMFITGSLISIILFFVTGIVAPFIAKKIGYDAPISHILSYFTGESFSFLGLAMEFVLTGIIILLYVWNDDKEDDFIYFQVVISVFTLWFYIIFGKFSLISRICDLIQVIFIILIPYLLVHIQDIKKKTLLLIIILLSSGFILFADINATCKNIQKNKGYEDFTVQTFPYFTVFDEQEINKYQ